MFLALYLSLSLSEKIKNDLFPWDCLILFFQSRGGVVGINDIGN